jgi:uncharacterized membrane protein YqgA involved in biofilm formation
VRGMSTTPGTSAALRIFVPVYLLVVGAGLLVGSALLFAYLPDEWFVATIAAVGGVTMLATMLALLTVARGR